MSEPLYMHPLVNQLRDTRWMKDYTVNMGNAAADEIERLTRELADARNDLDLERQEGWNIAIEEAVKVVNQARMGEIDNDLRSIAAAIRALAKP